MVVNEAVRDLLADAKPDVALDGLVAQAKRAGIKIGRNTIAKARRGELVNPTEQTLQALADLFGVDVRKLREAVGRRPGERGLGPWVPDPRSASLTQAQREALDRLIVTIVEQGGQSDAGQAEAEKRGGDDGGAAVAPTTPTAPKPPTNLREIRRNRMLDNAMPEDMAAYEGDEGE